MKRRSTFVRPPRNLWWMTPIVFFILLTTFGTIGTIMALRLAGILP